MNGVVVVVVEVVVEVVLVVVLVVLVVEVVEVVVVVGGLVGGVVVLVIQWQQQGLGQQPHLPSIWFMGSLLWQSPMASLRTAVKTDRRKVDVDVIWVKVLYASK